MPIDDRHRNQTLCRRHFIIRKILLASGIPVLISRAAFCALAVASRMLREAETFKLYVFEIKGRYAHRWATSGACLHGGVAWRALSPARRAGRNNAIKYQAAVRPTCRRRAALPAQSRREAFSAIVSKWRRAPDVAGGYWLDRP